MMIILRFLSTIHINRNPHSREKPRNTGTAQQTAALSSERKKVKTELRNGTNRTKPNLSESIRKDPIILDLLFLLDSF